MLASLLKYPCKEEEDHLWKAVIESDEDKVRYFLQKGVNPNSTKDSGTRNNRIRGNVLHLALQQLPVNKNIIKMLLDAGADPNGRFRDSCSEHHGSGEQCDISAIMMALEASIRHQDIDILKLLMVQDALVDYACTHDHTNALYGEYRSEGWTPLHIAAKTCYYDAVKLLLDNGAEVNSLMMDYQGSGETMVRDIAETALHIVVALADQSSTKFEVLAVAKLLLERNADPNSIRKDIVCVGKRDAEEYIKVEETALHIAMQNNCMELVKVLLEHGATMDIPYSFGSLRITSDQLMPQAMVLWNPNLHKRFPSHLRKLIKNILLIEQRQQWNIPKDVRDEIIRFCICGSEQWTIEDHLNKCELTKFTVQPLEGRQYV